MNRRNFLQQTSLSAAGLAILPGAIQAAEEPKEAAASSFRAVFLSDVHVKPTEKAEAGMRKALQKINSKEFRPDFIINGGDAIMDALNASKEKVQQQWDVWNRVMKDENKLPIYHCIGNHDAWGWQMTAPEVKQDPLYDKKWVMKEHGMQERYYSFTKNNWTFIVLDSAQENNGGYIARIDEPQYQWLETTLAATPKDNHICIVSHIPIVSFCSAMFVDENQANGDWRISRALLHVDARKLVDLFKKFPNIRTCLSGHIHLQDEVEYFGIRYFCNGAISGNWWGGAFKGFAPAYADFEFSKDGNVKRKMIAYES